MGLWILQALLCFLFVFAGVAKLAMPAEVLAKTGLPVGLLRFVAVAEICGAAGLILPGLLRIKRALTPIAAAGLVIVMIGATSVTAVTQGLVPALFPLTVGVLLAVVIRARREWLRELRGSPRSEPRSVDEARHTGHVR